jgi:hypothetical protein
MLRLTACFLFSFVSLVGVTRADYYFGTGAAQQSGLIESNTVRAVYLGRLSTFSGTGSNPNVGTAAKFTSMYAGAVIRGATNVALYGGRGNISFESAVSNGNMYDTGLRFSNTNQTSVQSIFIPGLPPPTGTTAPFSLSDATGTGMRDILATQGGLDFWLVGDATSSFTAPSQISGTQAANFLVYFNASAVPEPSSILLGLAAASFGALKLRRRKIALKANA